MNEQRQIPVVGEVYRHFKDKVYQIVTIAEHADSGQQLVIYQAMYGEFKVYARALDMFLSEVDHIKYPQVTQKYRFEKISIAGQVAKNETAPVVKNVEPVKTIVEEKEELENQEDQVSPLLEFLEAKGHYKRIQVIEHYKNILTEDMIDAMSLTVDCTLTSQGLEEKYKEFHHFLDMKSKYEIEPR